VSADFPGDFPDDRLDDFPNEGLSDFPDDGLGHYPDHGLGDYADDRLDEYPDDGLGDYPDDRPGAVPDPLPGDLLGDIASSEPGLDVLLSVLAAEPTPDELAGESAALAMFRSSRSTAAAVPGPPAPEPSASGPRPPGPHASRPHAPGRRASSPRELSRPPSGWRSRPAWRFAAAVTLAAAAGFAVAAYTEALPAPLQHVAYGALGFAGVPDSHHSGPATTSSGQTGPGRAHGGSHAPGGAPSSAPGSPQPGASASASGPPPAAGPEVLSVTTSSSRIVAGGSETFTGQLTHQGHAVAGARLSLQERAAGQPSWRPVGSATTDADGKAVVTVAHLTRNAGFRLAGPGRELSQPVLVIVVPPVSASVTVSPAGKSDVLTASSPLASPGNAVVLQIWTGVRWRSVQVSSLNAARQVTFVIRAPARSREYRTVLLPTTVHGMSVSNTVTAPPR
jgi:hypothetical protein